MRRNWYLAPLAVMACLLNTPANGQDDRYATVQPLRARRTFHSASQTPPVSPYLNLMRTDVPASLNYFSLVRPQLEQEQAMAQLASHSASQATLSRNVPATRRTATRGHVSRFMDYSNFYFRKPGQ